MKKGSSCNVTQLRNSKDKVILDSSGQDDCTPEEDVDDALGEDNVEEEEDPRCRRRQLRKVAGIKNPSGQDCFAISVLHLLAQTELAERLEVKPDHKECTEAACILGKYVRACVKKKYNF